MEHEQKVTETAAEKADRLERRDGELYVALGLFIGIVGLPVLIGTYWAAQTSERAAIVNAVCGATLLLIAAASMVYGWVILRRRKHRA